MTNGYIDLTGKLVFETDYDESGNFFEGLAAVKINDKAGFIDKSGKQVIKTDFQDVWSFSDGLAAVVTSDLLDGGFGFINREGKTVIKPQYMLVNAFNEGVAACQLKDLSRDKWIFIDKQGNNALPNGGPANTLEVFLGDIFSTFTYATHFSEGIGNVHAENHNYYFIDKEGDPVGDGPEGLFVMPGPDDYFQDANSFKEGLAAVKKSGSWGFINTKGEMVIEPQFWDAGSFCDGLAIVINKRLFKSKAGFINTKGEMVIEQKYDGNTTLGFSDGLAAIMKNGKWGFINKKGETQIEPQFDWIKVNVEETFFCNGLGAVKLNGKWGFINNKGEFVIEPKYDFVNTFSDGLARVKTSTSSKEENSSIADSYYGLIDHSKNLNLTEWAESFGNT